MVSSNYPGISQTLTLLVHSRYTDDYNEVRRVRRGDPADARRDRGPRRDDDHRAPRPQPIRGREVRPRRRPTPFPDVPDGPEALALADQGRRDMSISVIRGKQALRRLRRPRQRLHRYSGGSLTSLLGPSGSGKSTLLRAIAGLDSLDSGTVIISSNDVSGASPQKRDIGFVFQHYAAFKHLNVRDNIAFGLKIRKRPKAEIDKEGRRAARHRRTDGLPEAVPRPAVGWPASAHGTGARWRWTRRSSCSTSRSALSTRRSARTCASGCGDCTTRSTSRPSW